MMGARFKVSVAKYLVLLLILSACAMTLPIADSSTSADEFSSYDPGVVDPGSGDMSINNETEFMDFYNRVNNGDDMRNKTVTLLSDVTMTPFSYLEPMNPVGSETGGFSGTFNGSGYTLTASLLGSGENIGLFSKIGVSGSVMNLKLSIVAGTSSNPLVLDNSIGQRQIGLIAGINEGSISDCDVVSGSSIYVRSAGSISVGGIAGTSSSSGSIYSCKVTVDISAEIQAVNLELKSGGIVGTNLGTVSYSDFFGNINSNSTAGSCKIYAGGIAGSNNGSIAACTVGDPVNSVISANSTETVEIGGIAGVNNGTVSRSSVKLLSISASANSVAGGGIAGSNNGTIGDCKCTSTLTSGNSSGSVYIGGIAGNNYNAIRNCSSAGAVNLYGGYLYAGGIVGRNSNVTAVIMNCGSEPTITANGTNYVVAGGIIGIIHSGSLINSHHSGNVTGSAATVRAGGLIGSAEIDPDMTSPVENCVSSGNVQATGTNTIISGSVGWVSGQGTLTAVNGFWYSSELLNYHLNPEFTQITALSNGDGQFGSGDNLRFRLNQWVVANKDYNDPNKMYRPWKAGVGESIPVLHDTMIRLYMAPDVSYLEGVSRGMAELETIELPQGWNGKYNVIKEGRAVELVIPSLSLKKSVNGFTDATGWIYDGSYMTLYKDEECSINFQQQGSTGTGTISSNPNLMRLGEVVTFEVTPPTGYRVENATVNGEQFGRAAFTKQVLKNPVDVTVKYEAMCLVTVNVNGPGSGTVNPTSVYVEKNSHETITITPNYGFGVKSVYVNGVKFDISETGDNLTLFNVAEDKLVVVTFDTYFTLTPTNTGTGTVSFVPQTAIVFNGETATFNLMTGPDSYISNVDAGGKEYVLDGNSLSIADVRNAFNINVEVMAYLRVNLSADGDGSATAIIYTFRPGETFNIAATPGSETIFIRWSDGNTQPIRTLTPTDNVTLTAFFRKPIITVEPSSNGSINPGTMEVVKGGNATFNITAAAGYSIGDVRVDGASVGRVTSYAFSNVTTDRSISATFEPIPIPAFVISVSCDEGGTMNPSSTFTVQSGDGCTVSITPNAGYTIKDVKVDGSSVGKVPSYAFDNVTSNHSISATFERTPENVYTIAVSCGEGGKMDPPSNFTIAAGGSRTVTITPNNGYSVKDVKVDGSSVGPVSSYTFSGASSNHSISATFERMFTITVTCGDGGTADPASKFTVAAGGSRTVAITPNAGYAIKDVRVDGSSVGPVSSYTFSNVTSDRSISVTFERMFTITVKCGDGGTSDPASKFTVAAGGSRTVAITPDAGFVIKDVRVNGTSIGPVSSYTFTTVSANQDIKISFEKEEKCTVTLAVEGEGSVSGGGQYAKDSNATVSAQPADGFKFVSWSDGGAQIHAFQVGADTSLTAKFEKIVGETFNVQVDIGAGGSFVGNTTVPRGESVKITIIPDEGYRIDAVIVDGNVVGSPSFLVLDGVADHSVEIRFSEFRNAVTTMFEDGTVITEAEYTDGGWNYSLSAISRNDGTSDVKVRVIDDTVGVWTEFHSKNGEASITIGGNLAERQSIGYLVMNGQSDDGQDMVLNAGATQHALQGLDRVRALLSTTQGTETIVLVDISSGGEGSTRSTIKVDGETLKLLADKGCAFQIVSSIARTEFDSKSINGMSNGSNAVFTTRLVDPKMLEDELSEILGGRKTFAVSVTIGGNEIKNLKGMMTLHMFVDPSSKQNPEDASIIMADLDGYNREIRGQYIVASSEVSLVTDRLAYYGVVLGGDDMPVKKDDTTLLVIIGVIAVAAGALTVFSYRVRRNRATV